MSHQDDNHGKAHVIHSKGGGGGGKWLVGGLAAAVLLGGGYYAWQKLSPMDKAPEQVAYNETYDDDGTRAQPLPPLMQDDSSSSTAAIDDDATAASQPTRTASASTTTRRRAATTAARAPEPVPETVVGVTPASMTMQEEEPVIVQGRRPVWTRAPSARRLSAAYPQTALERGREGEARLSCTVLENGALDCVRVSETRGFGAAALRVSRMFRHATQRADGSSTAGAPVNLRVVFRMADDTRRG